MAVLGRVAGAVFRAPVPFYDLGLGVLLGHRFLLLTHRGRKTGLVRRTMVEVLRWEPATRTAYVISGLGEGSQWLRNLEAGGGLEVRCGGDRYVPQWRRVPIDEAADVLEDYEHRHRLAAFAIAPVLGRLAGVDYDGTDAARRAVAERLPVLRLSPVPPHPGSSVQDTPWPRP